MKVILPGRGGNPPPTPPPKKPPKPPPVVEAPVPQVLTLTEGPGGRVGLPVIQEINLPPMECSTCHIGAECPEYREGYICFYEKSFKSFNVRTSSGLVETMEAMIAQNVKRLQVAFLSEQVVSGSQIDPNVTRLSSEIMGQMARLLEFKRATQTVTVTAKGEKSSGGILSKLFGARKDTNTIELNPGEEQQVVGGQADEVTVTMVNRPGVGE